MLNLDTHILLFALDGTLTPAERTVGNIGNRAVGGCQARTIGQDCD